VSVYLSVNMKPKSAKNKGRILCKTLKKKLEDSFNFKPGDVEITSSGAGGMDLKLSPHARRLFPFAVECKNQELLNIWKAYSQAASNCPHELMPLVVFKRNRTDPYVMLDLEDFLWMAKSLFLSENSLDVAQRSDHPDASKDES